MMSLQPLHHPNLLMGVPWEAENFGIGDLYGAECERYPQYVASAFIWYVLTKS